MRRVCALVSAWLLAACQSTPPASPRPTTVPAGPDATHPVLAPPDAVGTRSATQIIHAAYGARVVVLRTVIEAAPGKLDVVGVTATGQRVFTAHYDGTTIDARKSTFVPDKLDPER